MEFKLIRFVRSNPFMYDREHISYRNQILKEEKWSQISNELNVPVDVLKKRWKSLRDRFFRLRKRNSGKSTYKYYSNLIFLCDVETSEQSNCKINEVVDDNILTRSEDSFLLDQASFSSFSLNDTETTAVAASEKQDRGENVEEVFITESNTSVTQHSTPFRLFLESIALTVEDAKFSMNEIIRLQMSILQLVQNEMNNRGNDD